MTLGQTVPDNSVAPGSPLHFPAAPDRFRWDTLSGVRADPLEALMSSHFPAHHGFTCRVRNRGSGASLLGVRDQVEADLDLLERAAGIPAVHFLRQVHGDDVHVVSGLARPAGPPFGDALVTRIPGTAVAIKAADCVPVLLADPVSGAVAGAHAGWRGTLARVVEKATLELAVEVGASPSRLAAVIGPAIRACCFEVGREVVSAFRENGHDVDRFAFRQRAAGRPHLDLVLANRQQLVEAGIREDMIEDADLCTRCEPAFHSYRREGPAVGRNWSVVVVGGERRQRLAPCAQV